MLKTIQLGKQLTKAEMRKLAGGHSAGTCCSYYKTGCADTGGPASCCGGGTQTMAEAKESANNMALEQGSGGAGWCCDSCNNHCDSLA